MWVGYEASQRQASVLGTSAMCANSTPKSTNKSLTSFVTLGSTTLLTQATLNKSGCYAGRNIRHCGWVVQQPNPEPGNPDDPDALREVSQNLSHFPELGSLCSRGGCDECVYPGIWRDHIWWSRCGKHKCIISFRCYPCGHEYRGISCESN